MAQKPEIQYVGRFYVHGSEARALEAEVQKKQKRAQAPQPKYVRTRLIQVDVTAIVSIVVAAVMMVTLAMSMVSLQGAWQELETAQTYVGQLQSVNLSLKNRYLEQHDLQAEAEALGLVSASELEVISISPQPNLVEEESWKDQIIWSIRHLFEA